MPPIAEMTSTNSHTSDFSQLTTVEFLKQIPWADDADASLVALAEKGDEKKFWTALTKGLFGLGPRAGRSKTVQHRITAAMTLWSRGAFEESEPLSLLVSAWRELGKQLDAAHEKAYGHLARKKNKSAGKIGKARLGTAKISRKQSQALAEYLNMVSFQPPSDEEILVLAELLRHLGPSLPAKLGLPLWQRVVSAGIHRVPKASPEAETIRDGEVPWVLGLFLSHIAGMKTLENIGREKLSAVLEDCTDTDGTLQAEEMHQLDDWLPPLVRAAEWGHAAEVSVWTENVDERFAALLKRLAACLAGDGHFAFQAENQTTLPMLLTACRPAGISKREWPRKTLLELAEVRPNLLGSSQKAAQPSTLKKRRRATADVDTDEIVQQSDWAKTVCLRSSADRLADIATVTHHETFPSIDVSPFGQNLFQGAWEIDVCFDGAPVDDAFKWTCICWHTDDDGDYLELQHTIDENRRIERQIFLSRTDHFLVMADCVSGAGEASIEYSARWPLSQQAGVERSNNTRECGIRLGEGLVRSFPLALPERITHSTSGRWGISTEDEEAKLELRQSSQGGLYAPVIFDWTPARQSSPAQWRTLTVTEDGPKVGRDRAAGHRIKIGNQQLLIYRSLTPDSPQRTVLGHHTNHETVIGRVTKNGDVKPLLIVE